MGRSVVVGSEEIEERAVHKGIVGQLRASRARGRVVALYDSPRIGLCTDATPGRPFGKPTQEVLPHGPTPLGCRTGCGVVAHAFGSLVLASAAHAQGTALVSGTVVDAGGQRLAGVAVELRSAAEVRGALTTTSNRYGYYRMAGLTRTNLMRPCRPRPSRRRRLFFQVMRTQGRRAPERSSQADHAA